MYDFLAHLWFAKIMFFVAVVVILVAGIINGDFVGPKYEPGDIVSEIVRDDDGNLWVDVAIEGDDGITTEARRVEFSQGGHCSNWYYYPPTMS